MERMLPHSFRMDYKSSLSDAANFFLLTLFIIVIKLIIFGRWEHWFWLSNDFKWLQFSIFTNRDESPIVETTLPEFSKIDANLLLDVILLYDVSLLEFMPSQQVQVVSNDWRWSS